MSISQTAQISLASAALLNGGAVPSPVVQNGNATPALASEAAQLSQDSSAIVLLGGGSGNDVSTYDAAGLLNGFATAGTLQGGLLSPSGGSRRRTAPISRSCRKRWAQPAAPAPA
ncbi:hypothetical protein HA051_20640 [Chromobacterium vaccinii]|nr:hypothetical protein [Chromobacterium vaccinii]